MTELQLLIIATHERKLKKMTARLGNLYGLESREAHNEIVRRRRVLGRLYLVRDKERRPEIYR